ncbi:hypothetical protein HYZ78_04205 [Candidatus Microgenomates bacterium]|nr:hypothetical protein [Candidatus Microgenomates bacterium]
MHAYLIAGPNTKEEVYKLLTSYSIMPINLMTLTPSPSHRIESIREIIHYLTLQTARRDENRGILIEDAHLMTEPAQNAFLKTLEEPPANTIIILTTPRDDLLLPTIVSRCVLISTLTTLGEVDLEQEQEIFEKLSQAGIGEKVQFAEATGKTREDALAFVNGQLNFLHTKLHANATSNISLLKALHVAHHDLSRNVNPKMTLFELLKNYTP